MVLRYVAILLALSSLQAKAATLSFADVIPDVSRDYFNGFEALPQSITLPNTHSEGGITVTQVNFGGLVSSSALGWSPQGLASWNPQFGLSHFSRITLTGGGSFGALGMLIGSGNILQTTTVWFRLWLNGAVVQTGSFTPSAITSYVSFLGGGFDTLDIRDATVPQTGFDNGGQPYLSTIRLDSIEALAPAPAPVPLPASALLLAAALGVAGLIRRRRT